MKLFSEQLAVKYGLGPNATDFEYFPSLSQWLQVKKDKLHEGKPYWCDQRMKGLITYEKLQIYFLLLEIHFRTINSFPTIIFKNFIKLRLLYFLMR